MKFKETRVSGSAIYYTSGGAGQAFAGLLILVFAVICVGRGFYHDNQGDLQIMNRSYREQHRMNRPRRQRSGKVTSGGMRQRQPWFSPKHYASVMKLKDDMARLIGEDFAGTVAEILSSNGK